MSRASSQRSREEAISNAATTGSINSPELCVTADMERESEKLTAIADDASKLRQQWRSDIAKTLLSKVTVMAVEIKTLRESDIDSFTAARVRARVASLLNGGTKMGLIVSVFREESELMHRASDVLTGAMTGVDSYVNELRQLVAREPLSYNEMVRMTLIDGVVADMYTSAERASRDFKASRMLCEALRAASQRAMSKEPPVDEALSSSTDEDESSDEASD